jgi:hypothetical protein
MTAHTPEECQSIFVAWKWLIGILAVSLTAMGGVGWGLGKVVTENSAQHTIFSEEELSNTARIIVLERVSAASTNKMDTIIYILRSGPGKGK